jgi:5'(3')-deoxyribonucleotidase
MLTMDGHGKKTKRRMKMSKGMRFDDGKIRHDLLPPMAINELAKVLTFGAQKYAPNNWMKGMKWSRVIGSLKRHLNAIERGEDYDPETGLLHSSHVMCNAAFLTEYYKIYPQWDDRTTLLTKQVRIGIDIDDVLADFLTTYCTRYNIPIPSSWMYDANFQQRYEEVIADPDFYRNLDIITPPESLPAEPVVYITSRDERTSAATLDWLFFKNNYPVADVVFTKDKLSICKKYELDVFIDDKYETFLNLNNNDVFCYLFDAPHNQRYNVGHRRINKDTITNIL